MLAHASCPTTPLNFNAADCVIDSTYVCTTNSTSFTCDVSWSDEEATVTIVSDFDSGVPYEAWGEANGELFCCESNIQYTPTAVHIEGSIFDDILEFTWDALSYNLNGVSTNIAATIDGNAGKDTIRGSHASPNIAETLNGGLGDDNIRGNADADVLNGGGGKDLLLGGAGDDECNGDDADDEVFGGDGADVLSGGAGADVMNGDAGDDVMYGGAGRDRMSGAAGDDTMDGGTDGDTMCGDGEVGGDYLYAGETTDEGVGLRDILYAASAADDVVPGSSSTSTDPWSNCVMPGCPVTAYVTTPPPTCP